jgi:hypothetical protein
VFAEGDKDLVRVWAQITAMQRASKNRLLPRFSELRAENGWHAEVVTHSEADKERGKAALISGRDLRKAEREARILGAPDIERHVAEELVERQRNCDAISQAEQAMLDRYFIAHFYVAPIDASLIEFDDEGRMRVKIALLELLYKNDRSLHGHDRYQVNTEFEVQPHYWLSAPKGKEAKLANNHIRWNTSRAPFDRDFWSPKVDLLTLLLDAAGLIDFGTREFHLDAEVTTASLGKFEARFREHRQRIEHELGLVMRSDITQKPTQQLGDLLGLIGLRLAKVAERRVGETKERIYRVDRKTYEHLLEVISRREQRNERRRSDGA